MTGRTWGGADMTCYPRPDWPRQEVFSLTVACVCLHQARTATSLLATTGGESARNMLT